MGDDEVTLETVYFGNVQVGHCLTRVVQLRNPQGVVPMDRCLLGALYYGLPDGWLAGCIKDRAPWFKSKEMIAWLCESNLGGPDHFIDGVLRSVDSTGCSTNSIHPTKRL